MHFGATKRSRLSMSRRKRDLTAALYTETVAVPDRPMSGRELILAVEDLYNRLSARTLQQNQFWEDVLESVLFLPLTQPWLNCRS